MTMDETGEGPVIFSPTGRVLTGMAADDQAAELRALGEKAGELDPLGRSVINPRTDVTRPGLDAFVVFLAAQTSAIAQWGANPKLRDRQLRDFITQEGYFNSALGIISARNSALSWKITGEEATAEASQEMLNNANFGLGWEHFIATLSIDLYTQDNGAFIELTREQRSPEAPVIGLNTLDSARCYQTGNPRTPVLYEDREGRMHEMQWFEVVHLMEMPSTATSGWGGYFTRLQYCAFTRVLNAVEILRSIQQYKGEKLGGRNARAVHLLRGVSAEQVQDALSRQSFLSDAQGNTQYVAPPMVGNVDPSKEVGHDTIELASLPDGFNEKETIEAYITILAMGFGTDYQEFAPLASGNLGTSQQSQTLHQKSRGKGVGLFQSLVTRVMNFHGVLPRNVRFDFDEEDLEAEQQNAEIVKTRAESRSIRILSGELTPSAARQVALDDGDLSDELFEALQDDDNAQQEARDDAMREIEEMMGLAPSPEQRTGDLTPDVTVEGEQPTTQSGLRSLSPEGYVLSAPQPLGKVLADRLRAKARNGDAAAVDAFEQDMRELGVYEIEVPAGKADQVAHAGLQALAQGWRQVTESDPARRAGPDEERLEFEEEVGVDIGRGLREMRRMIAERMREAAERESATV